MNHQIPWSRSLESMRHELPCTETRLRGRRALGSEASGRRSLLRRDSLRSTSENVLEVALDRGGCQAKVTSEPLGRVPLRNSLKNLKFARRQTHLGQ